MLNIPCKLDRTTCCAADDVDMMLPLMQYVYIHLYIHTEHVAGDTACKYIQGCIPVQKKLT